MEWTVFTSLLEAHGRKREPPAEDGEPWHRFSQQTVEVVDGEPTDWKEGMNEILLTDLWVSDTEVLTDAMTSLSSIVSGEADGMVPINRHEHFFDIGGHMVIVEVMNANPDCEDLHHLGICVLKNASYAYLNRGRIVEVKGVEASLTAMKKFHSVEILVDGFELLSNLLEGDEASMNHFIDDYGGISLILESMKSYPNDSKLIEAMCDLLTTLSFWKDFRKTLVEPKVVSVLAKAFECHCSNNEIKTNARAAIQHLLKRSDE
jgi:hypothetical protein